MENKTRAFVAITFPDEVTKEVALVQSLFPKNKFIGKLTELENLHLTLKFFGEVSSDELEKIKLNLSKIRFHSFEASLLQTGTFSFRGSPRIVWIKVGGEAIHKLQKQIDDALQSEFRSEERFMSHLTVARIKYVKDKEDFKEKIKKLKVKKIKFKVSSFKLMSSELRLLGPVYNVVDCFNATAL